MRVFETYRGKKYWIDEEKGILFVETGKLHEIPLSEITKVEMWGTPTCTGLDIYYKSRKDSVTILATDYEDALEESNKKGWAEMEEFLSLYEHKLPFVAFEP